MLKTEFQLHWISFKIIEIIGIIGLNSNTINIYLFVISFFFKFRTRNMTRNVSFCTAHKHSFSIISHLSTNSLFCYFNFCIFNNFIQFFNTTISYTLSVSNCHRLDIVILVVHLHFQNKIHFIQTGWTMMKFLYTFRKLMGGKQKKNMIKT